MEKTIVISTDGGKEWKPILVNHDPLHASRISIRPTKKWALIDKQGNHMVFIHWQDKEVFIVDVEDGQADEYEVNKVYELKFDV
jgi:hypothetical protein